MHVTCFSTLLPLSLILHHKCDMELGCSVAGAAGKKIQSNQYSLTEYYSPVHKGEVQLPAIYFLYDLSPIMVAIKDARASFAHLLVRLCAVIGGVFAITGGLSAFHHAVCKHSWQNQALFIHAAAATLLCSCFSAAILACCFVMLLLIWEVTTFL